MPSYFYQTCDEIFRFEALDMIDIIKRKGSIDRYKKGRGRKKMYDTDHAGHDKSFRYLFSPIGRVTSPSCRHEVLPYYFVSLDLLLFRRVLKETRLYSLTR